MIVAKIETLLNHAEPSRLFWYRRRGAFTAADVSRRAIFFSPSMPSLFSPFFSDRGINAQLTTDNDGLIGPGESRAPHKRRKWNWHFDRRARTPSSNGKSRFSFPLPLPSFSPFVLDMFDFHFNEPAARLDSFILCCGKTMKILPQLWWRQDYSQLEVKEEDFGVGRP